MSVAAVRTTRPKYLVFDTDDAKPAYVLQFGAADEMKRLDRILQALGPSLGTLAPRSVACGPWEGHFVHVQAGLEGLPWFMFQRTLRTRASWLHVLQRALVSLSALHDASRRVPEFVRPVVLAEELDQQVALCRQRELPWPPEVEGRISCALKQLRRVGTIHGVAQHGDYGLNNLLLSNSGEARIIDFEEFGLSYLPLQDEIALALSLYLIRGESSEVPLQEALDLCLSGALRRWPDLVAAVDGLLLYQLVWRINQCHAEPRRARLRSQLLTLLTRQTIR